MTEIQKLHHRFCDYSLAFKGNTPRTIQWLRDIFQSFFRFANIERPDQINRQIIESWIFEGKLQKKWSAQTIKNRLQALSLFLDWLIKEEYLMENPIKKISRPKIPKRIPRHLSKEEANHLLDWVKNFPYGYKFERTRAAAIIACFIFTGIRRDEIRKLRMEDIDLTSRTLFVKSGKGEKDRIVPINSRLVEILEEYLQDRKRLKKTCPYFFTAMRADTQMGEKVITRLIGRVRKKSGIYFYPHMLRHTFATLMLEGGCNLFALSKMMGHSDIKTTTIYLSATTAHLQEEMSKHPLNGS